jgi:hypothetical protein
LGQFRGPGRQRTNERHVARGNAHAACAGLSHALAHGPPVHGHDAAVSIELRLGHGGPAFLARAQVLGFGTRSGGGDDNQSRRTTMFERFIGRSFAMIRL